MSSTRKASTTVCHTVNTEYAKQATPTNTKIQTKINRINKIIKSATFNKGYVCGSYVRNVLVPLSQNRPVEIFKDTISLRFKTYNHFMNFLCNKIIMIINTDVTHWNEPRFTMNIKNSRNDGFVYNVTISANDPIKDVDVKQLIATIDETGTIFSSTDSLLTVSELMERIINKRVKISSIVHEQSILNNIIARELEFTIKKYIKEGWTVEHSKTSNNFDTNLALVKIRSDNTA